MDALQAVDVVNCQFLLAIFIGTTLKWYQHYPSYSISSWEQVTYDFLTQFFTSRDATFGISLLAYMRQQEGESLCNYCRRFNEVDPRVKGMTKESKLIIIITGLLKNNPIQRYFIKNIYDTLSEFFHEDHGYFRVTETMKIHDECQKWEDNRGFNAKRPQHDIQPIKLFASDPLIYLNLFFNSGSNPISTINPTPEVN